MQMNLEYSSLPVHEKTISHYQSYLLPYLRWKCISSVILIYSSPEDYFLHTSLLLPLTWSSLLSLQTIGHRPFSLFLINLISRLPYFYCCWVTQSCPALCDPVGDPWAFPGKTTGVGCHFLLQRIFPTQGWNPHLLHWKVDSLPLSCQGSPNPFLTQIKFCG